MMALKVMILIYSVVVSVAQTNQSIQIDQRNRKKDHIISLENVILPIKMMIIGGKIFGIKKLHPHWIV